MTTTAYIEEFGTGWEKWNVQAWVDFLVIKSMMSKTKLISPSTIAPPLRNVARFSLERASS